MLKDIAYCYKQVGDYRAAIPIAAKATQNFSKLQDTTRLIRSLNLLGNCYRTQQSYWVADSVFRVAFGLANQKPSNDLSNLYGDFALLQAQQLKYKSAIHYQKLALTTYPEKSQTKTCIRLIKLTRFYLQAQKLDSAQHYLTQALALKPASLEARVHLYATKGVLHFMNRQIAQGRAAYQVCDTVLRQLGGHSASLVQQKFARKTAYEVYRLGYQMLDRLWFYGNDKDHFAPARDWFKQRMDMEKNRYEDIQVSVSLKDSLVIARTAPKTKVVKRLNPWWWVLMVAGLGVGGWLVYKQRTRSLRASENFVKAIQTSPIKGFDQLNPKEIAMLAQIESRIKRPLKMKEIKILLMIGRQNNYNQIHLATGIPVGTIKSSVNKLKDLCQVANIRDLM